MRPGDRKRRWKESSAASGVIFVAMAIFVITGVDGPAGLFIGVSCLAMAYFDYRDFVRGPSTSNRIPERARREARMPGLRGELARAAIREVEGEKS